MASTRQILSRRRAAQNINKVTGTMETISAVRYRQLYGSWYEGQEFYDSLARLAYLIVTAEQTIEHPLLFDNQSRTHALVVIGSDRGLCGAYNSNIFKLLDVHRKMAKRFNRELKIYAKGNRVINHLRSQQVPIEHIYDEFEDVPSVDQTEEIANHFIEQYMRGEIGRLGMVYTRFFSAASQQAQTLSVLPVAELIDDLTTRATVIWPWEVEFEDFLLSPDPEQIFDGLAKMMIRTVISGCFHEAVLSEHLSRVIAMRSASDNAQEMIESLTHEYNRERQSQITNELLDILGGALQ
ncbi:F-ATPase gamma subunit [Anaerohalosphaera lusitana]|uniref:ATP synthase gamma chain n=1 Tax=Anaerohalosphaera lusitana TaxID=1936003 RepID=A0A1U9NNT3_9BACT|nr:ATP synthase F1 subunit gamma [Anaerohalosphaera lusitana]AQT69388.1 F-ATPase gamma subunit [Anaerohalosphaera lusitana]